MIELRRTDSSDPDFRALVRLLDQDLAARDGADHSFYAQFNKIDTIKQAMLAYQDGQPVGCGAFKPHAHGVAEVKRMFVLPAFRGKRIAAKILEGLEQWAGELSYRSLVLETGKKQPEAIQLYTRSGYQIISNFGPYTQVENSVCLQKELSAPE